MKPPRLRFTLRRLMVVVVVVALSIQVFRLGQLSWKYRREALDHAGEAQLCEDAAWGLVRMTNNTKEEAATQAGQLLRVKAHHEAMREKYEWAARHPWRPVEPDLPEPE